MSVFVKKNIPIFFFAAICFFWGFFYQTSNALNEYGTQKPEWLLLIDGLVVLPILCFLCVKDKKQATLKAVVYGGLIVLLGSYVIPESAKVVWPYLESLRYLAIAAFILLEISTLCTVIFAIKGALSKDSDPDMAISQPIERILGKGTVSLILSFEARVWTYALFSKQIKRQNFMGEHHFSYHMKDGTQSNQLGFILIMLFELPIMHMLLHFVWSPFAANIISGLTLIGLVFFIAEYRAMAIRPISITSKGLIIRYGVGNPLVIPFIEMENIQLNAEVIRRSNLVKRYNLAGAPNVGIKLSSGKTIYLGLDSPKDFISSLEKCRTANL
ncbi:hypothetical protein [Aliiglaciecola aliphaticivorans]